MYSLPIITYNIVNEHLIQENKSMIRSIKTSFVFLFLAGPLYSCFAAYVFYIPKEKYWSKLNERKRYSPLDYWKNEKPKAKIDLKKPRSQS